MHGGMSTGPRTPQGLERSRKANWKHGWYSAEAISDRRKAAAAIRLLRQLVAGIRRDEAYSTYRAFARLHGLLCGPRTRANRAFLPNDAHSSSSGVGGMQ